MSFTEKVVMQAWDRSAGLCECERRNHRHFYTPCGKRLVREARGMVGQGGWEANRMTSSGGDELSNCEILCWDCYRLASKHLAPSPLSRFYPDTRQQIEIGDYIKLESGEEGRVTETSRNSIRIGGLEGSDIIVPNSTLIQRTAINYGRAIKTAKEPFRFYSRTLLKELTGLKAKNLRELVSILKKVPDSIVYYHSHHFLEDHQYLNLEPANDFAIWVTDALGDEVLGERLASVDPFDFRHLRALTAKLVNIIEEHLVQHANHREAVEGKEFHFIKSVSIIVPTPYVAHDLREFVEGLRKISLDSLYFHIFESRIRLENGLNDFTNWLNDSLGEKDLGEEIRYLDPYTYTLEGLRSSLIQLIEKRMK